MSLGPGPLSATEEAAISSTRGEPIITLHPLESRAASRCTSFLRVTRPSYSNDSRITGWVPMAGAFEVQRPDLPLHA